MIAAFVQAWDEHIKADLTAKYTAKRPGGYNAIFADVVRLLCDLGVQDNWSTPDPERITVINHGDYQGCLVFVVAETGYQPDTYWYVRQFYGSCSGCDTFESIRNYETGPAHVAEVEGYLTLALHFIQGLRCMSPTP